MRSATRFTAHKRRWLSRRDRPLAEIHVPIAPTPSFLLQLRLLTGSLRQSGGALADAPVHVTVSRDVEPYDLDAEHPWARELGISWRWVDEEVWERHGIFGTALERFRRGFTAPNVLMLDADMVCTGPLDELAGMAEGKLGGCITHLAPCGSNALYRSGAEWRDAPAFWSELHAQAGLPAPDLRFQHTGWPFMDDDPGRRSCPAYFNLGLLVAKADTMSAVGRVVFDEMAHVDAYVDTPFRCQLAVALALARTGVEGVALPLRWNFPNDPLFGSHYAEELENARILHYLRDEEIDRRRDVADLESVDALLRRNDLSPVNVRVRDRLHDAAALARAHA